MKKQVLYGTADYKEIVLENGYFVDKTDYIEKLETVKNPVFLRPRRFGKSFLCSMLRYYYDLNYANRFTELFGHTWIGQHPTPNRNRFLILSLDFSSLEIGTSLKDIEQNFKQYCNSILSFLRHEYAEILGEMPEILMDGAVSTNLAKLLHYIRAYRLPPMYVIIDEYDNFANQLVTTHQDALYHDITTNKPFFKTFFKTLKEGRKTGALTNVFITGVLPITIDDLASGYNIANFITLDPEFESLLGFTQDEVSDLLDEIYQDYQIPQQTRSLVEPIIKNHYNGYHFVNPEGQALYNSTLVMYFLSALSRHKTIPSRLNDPNLKTELSWVRRLTASNPQNTQEFVDQLTLHNQMPYDEVLLVEKFNLFQFFEKGFFPLSFFYLGMLTKKADFYLKLPNLNMQQIFVEYFNEIHQIEVSSGYTELMQRFLNKPDLEQLFKGYWEQYVSQLPEVIFQQVNENFYRTTFYELCSRYLSDWFIWHVERSYPQGKSDLEFVGKYHKKFAGIRWVIEFKYYSNSKLKDFKTTIDQFELLKADTEQINGYVEGLKKEYPEAKISKFVIYCFGNQGFRVFEVPNEC
jgi:hypothetical protein